MRPNSFLQYLRSQRHIPHIIVLCPQPGLESRKWSKRLSLSAVRFLNVFWPASTTTYGYANLDEIWSQGMARKASAVDALFVYQFWLRNLLKKHNRMLCQIDLSTNNSTADALNELRLKKTPKVWIGVIDVKLNDPSAGQEVLPATFTNHFLQAVPSDEHSWLAVFSNNRFRGYIYLGGETIGDPVSPRWPLSVRQWIKACRSRPAVAKQGKATVSSSLH